MRFRTRLRSSSALWAAPLALGVPVLYYLTGASKPESPDFGYAPTIVSAPLYYSYALAYAVVSALSAWESGRLKEGGGLQLAPARSRYRVAAETLWPVVALGWLMLIVPVVLALADYGVWPTEVSLRPLWLALVVCVAHAVIGCAVGMYVPKGLAAPVMAVVVWAAVSYTVTFDTMWPRHVSGGYFNDFMFGEATSYGALLPHVLFTGSLACAVALGWVRLSRTTARVGLALVVAVAGTGTARAMTSSWDANPPLLVDQAPMACAGKAPQVCVPALFKDTLGPARAEAGRVLEDFRAAGVTLTPRLVKDSVTEGRMEGSERSTAHVWRPPLSSAVRSGDLRYQITVEAVTPPCRRPDRTLVVAASLWATTVTDTDREYRALLREFSAGDPEEVALQERAEKEFREGTRLPESRQGDWYRHTLRAACGESR
ncbi:hypothetical protein OG453_05240 [Streptomyces sp. NBC_01381]|uniref:hypothetical protein n=1 Tax=Streptomyces sp. NBC_01381 TaxID=2903845 RepID=UPI002257B5AF|nr:hypothetical protein [Streptomyces sp. NBC_01381]MCX4666069.1 hypothetical protein [Streptomyces sp. NBC_01381]